MSIILFALSLGVISMIITFLAGLASGEVGLGTLTLRSCFTFCFSSAACYFLLMLFEMFDEKQKKSAEQIEEELTESDESEDESSENAEEGFQAAENYPKVNG